MLALVSKVCGMAKRRNRVEKRTRWWNEEVHSAVKEKRCCTRDSWTWSDEARQGYNEAKAEAVRKARNDEWVQLGREVEREAAGNQWSFCREYLMWLVESKGGVYT